MEAGSMLLQATRSCNWNKCAFCYRDKSYPFLAATPEEIKDQILAQLPLYPATTPVFFVGSNTFALPPRMQRDYLKLVNEYLPEHGRVAMFSRIDAIAAKSDEDPRELRELGLTQLYVGTENGDDAALALMSKGHTAAEALTQLKRLEAVGIDYVVFYILGLGGKGTGRRTALATAELFNKLRPRRITSTGMTVTEGTGAWEARRKGEFVDASEREKIEELRLFLENLTTDTYFDAMRYLNPLHFKLKNSDAETKAAILAEMDRILAACSDEELERAVDRKSMEEACKPERAR